METKSSPFISFVGASSGTWQVLSVKAIKGETLPTVKAIQVLKGQEPIYLDVHEWVLKAFISNLRYTERSEKAALDASSIPLGNPSHTMAALIPIKKTKDWWAMTQEERRAIFETKSQHIAKSMPYLPYVSRQLHHCRDLGEAFDFLTWFEFSPEHVDKFESLLKILRETEEWDFVEREVEIRLEKQ